MERITARYFIETPLHPEKAAAILAGEQSSGTFVPIPGETEKLKQQFAARVESVTPYNTVSEPSIPGFTTEKKEYHCADIEVSWSIENFDFTANYWRRKPIVNTEGTNEYGSENLKLADLSKAASD